ncbi:MAG: spore coat protein [Clostridia bacterium]|nr:spore coat protein [Clostridia bacterium]
MKLQKNQSTLNEKDAILDMLADEKQLMSLYATAIFEGSTVSMRNNFSQNFLSVAEDQYCLFSQMSARGYYQPKPANKALIDEATDMFKKQKKELKAQ